ncbi:hypothetical protein BDQ12DRAFT_41288 [Crucibulum laeve]|uniref:Uncharacterized protein n=1 Tax=Crucibulum laeve TaxID=68775 RepID=A0A5C3MU36_9AGAR|nr:hypothetical protein BDQ12DRAFT_41288 [Crucibulum laeve]
MRRALRFAAETLNVPNPYETEPPPREGQQPARQTKVESPAKPQANIAWEALPGESDDLPTPGRVSDDVSISISTELPPNPLNMLAADADLLMDRTYIPSTTPIITEVTPPHHPVQPARSPKTPPIKTPPIKVQAATETTKSEKDASAFTSKQKTTTIQQPTQPAKLTQEQQREMETQLRMAQRAANMLAPEKKQKGKQAGAKGSKEKAPVAVIKRPSQSKRKEEGVEEDGMLTKLSSFFKLK